MTIALFDIDKTLLSVNSAKLWMVEEARRGALPWRTAGRGLVWAALYGAGLVDVEGALREAVGTLRGAPEEAWRASTASFYETRLRGLIREGGRRAVKAHQERGEPVVLITSSSSYIAELLCEELGCDGASSNVFEVDEAGRFTGELREPLCYGRGKIDHALQWCERLGGELSDCTFYTDSYTDVPLMERVGRPVAVHPDPRLARLARRRGWPLVSWS